MKLSERGTSLLKIATGALLSASLLVPLRITWAGERELSAAFRGESLAQLMPPAVFEPWNLSFAPMAGVVQQLAKATGQSWKSDNWDGVSALPGSYASADEFYKANGLNPVFQSSYWNPEHGLDVASPDAPWNRITPPMFKTMVAATPAF